MLFPLTLSAFFLGVLIYTLSLQSPDVENGPYYGKMISPVTISEQSESFSLETTDGLNLQVSHFSEDATGFFFHEYKTGATCEVQGKVEGFAKATNYGEFNYASFMSNQGFDGRIIITRDNAVRCVGSSWKHTFYEQRNLVIDHFLARTPDSLKPWLRALVFGDQQGLDESVVESFRTWGLSHVLVISGLHVGLLCGIIYTVIYHSGLATLTQAKLILFLFLPLFAFIAGAQPSVLRATMTVFFLIILWTLRVKPSLTDLLSMIAFLLIIINPSSVYHVGFQFSFAVTFSLLLSASILVKDTRPWVLSIRVSFISQLAILPLQLHYFYQFSPLSVLFNLILVPYFTILFIPFIFLLLLSMHLLPSFLYEWIAHTGGRVHREIIDIAITIGNSLNIQWVTGSFSYLWFIPYYLCFFLMMIFLMKERRVAAFISGTSLTLLLILHGSQPYLDSEGSVTFLDVGQGDSAVIELPYRKGVILVDAAGPPAFQNDPDKTADRIIIPYLESRGIASVDAIFVTHDDTDHSGSISRLLDKKITGHLFISGFNEAGYEGKGEMLKKGDQYEIGEHSFEILAPLRKYEDKNDNSLVLYTELGGKYWLFTGDISEKVEKEMVSFYGDLPLDYLKVAHHGSKTSTSELFLETFTPEAGIISAGKNNRYGHPHPEVLERLTARNVRVWRTDRQGAVRIKFSEEEIVSMESYTKP